jgi:hypothetical protein
MDVQREQHVFYISHYMLWACFFNPQRDIVCFPSRNTLYRGKPRYVVEIRREKTRQHFMDWYTAHVYFVYGNRFKI